MIPVWLKITAVVAAAGVFGGWCYGMGRDDVQQKWDKEAASVANALVVAFADSANKTEAIRSEFIEYKKGAEVVTAGLERDVAAGRQRLRVKANCVRTTATTNASGTASGTAELDATARLDYYALRRGIDEQRGLLNLCRAELKKRSK